MSAIAKMKEKYKENSYCPYTGPTESIATKKRHVSKFKEIMADTYLQVSEMEYKLHKLYEVREKIDMFIVMTVLLICLKRVRTIYFT